MYTTVILLLLLSVSYAQQVFMQGWYWDYPKTANGASWADTLRLKASQLKTSGFTHVWFPPHAVAGSTNSNGYDPRDLFIGNQTTGLGTRTALNNMLKEFTTQGIAPVADMVYNHRDGGAPEINPAVKTYITNYTANKQPFPSDRFRCIVPLGGNSGNGAGDYFIKVSSKTQDPKFFNKSYKVYIETSKVKWKQGNVDMMENEPNGGGDCGENGMFTTLQLGFNMLCKVDGLGCLTDEFKLTLKPGDFNAAGDTLYISLNNLNDGYSDHRIYGIWNASLNKDIISSLQYQTFTNFNNMPSGRGKMNFEFFKPNTANANTTFLDGDWDAMFFFYDYDQSQPRTRDSLINYTKWNWDELGVRGLRMDAIKHFDPKFVGEMLNSMNASGKNPNLVVGEYFAGNADQSKAWINSVQAVMTPAAKAAIQPKVFDFSLRENLRQSCDDANFDVRNVFQGSLRDQGMSGFNIVTFINNHDFREQQGFNSLVRNNPDLAYAYILTNNQLGVPTVFYPDYYGYPAPKDGLYGYHPTNLPPYKARIDSLINVLKKYVTGSPSVDYLNRFNTPYSSNFISGSSNKALIYQLKGVFKQGAVSDVIVAINFGNTTLKVDHGINTNNGAIKPGAKFADVLKRSAFPYAVVSASNQIYMELPPKSYSVWVQQTALPIKTAINSQTLSADKVLDLEIYPNPVKGTALNVKIQSANSNNFNIRIFDAKGEQVHQQILTNSGFEGNYSLPVSKLTAGTYTLLVSNGAEEVRKQFVKN